MKSSLHTPRKPMSRRSSRHPYTTKAVAPIQKVLDRRWPGVVIAYLPARKQWVLQDRRTKAQSTWKIVAVFEYGEHPTFQEVMQLLKRADVTGYKTVFQTSKWYQESILDPEDEALELSRAHHMEFIRRELAPRIRTALKQRPFIPVGGSYGRNHRQEPRPNLDP